MLYFNMIQPGSTRPWFVQSTWLWLNGTAPGLGQPPALPPAGYLNNDLSAYS